MTKDSTASRTCRTRQSGVSLLEVLIAVLVLSFGLLGLAGLQTTNLRNNQSAMERSMAVFETHSIADAMRADRHNASNGNFNIRLEDDPPAGNTFAASVLRDWRGRITNSFGELASGAVACQNFRCVIIIQWSDERATQGSATQQVVTEVQI